MAPAETVIPAATVAVAAEVAAVTLIPAPARSSAPPPGVTMASAARPTGGGALQRGQS